MTEKIIYAILLVLVTANLVLFGSLVKERLTRKQRIAFELAVAQRELRYWKRFCKDSELSLKKANEEAELWHKMYDLMEKTYQETEKECRELREKLSPSPSMKDVGVIFVKEN